MMLLRLILAATLAWGPLQAVFNFESPESTLNVAALSLWLKESISGVTGTIRVPDRASSYIRSESDADSIDFDGGILKTDSVTLVSGRGELAFSGKVSFDPFGSASFTVKGPTLKPFVDEVATSAQTKQNFIDAYREGFVAFGPAATDVVEQAVSLNAIAVYDDLTTPKVYDINRDNDASFDTNLITGAFSALGTGTIDIDVGIDEAYCRVLTSNNLELTNGGTTTIDTGDTVGVAIGSASHIFKIKVGGGVAKYDGTPENWTDVDNTSGAVDIAAGSDGTLWVLRDLGGGDELRRIEPGGENVVLTLPGTPLSVAEFKRNTISFKTSTVASFGAFCADSGEVFVTTDGGDSFTSVGNFGGNGVGVGANGTLAIIGPDDPNQFQNTLFGPKCFVRPGLSVYKIELENGDVLAGNSSESVAENINIASSATVKLAGSLSLANPIVFDGTSSTLEIGLTSPLDQNITTSEVTDTNQVKLTRDLYLADGILGFVPQGFADIDLNGHVYHFGSLDSLQFNETAFTSAGVARFFRGLDFTYGTTQLQFSNPGDHGGIALHSNFRTQIGMTGFGHLYGNSNILDFSEPGAGTYSFFDLVDGDITLENVHIIGLQLFKNTSASARNIVLMDNVTIEISQYEPADSGGASISTTIDYGTGSDGSITLIVRGDNCKIITGSSVLELGDTSIGSNPCNITVEDGKVLTYDTLGQADACNVRVAGDGVVTLGAGSRIAHMASRGSAPTNWSVSIDTSLCTKYYLPFNKKLAADSQLSFTNPVPATPRTVTLDGAGSVLTFPEDDNVYFSLDENVNLTFQNIVLENFNPSSISFGAASASITFGDGVVVKIKDSLTIGYADRAWSFVGNATIDGNDKTLTVSGDDQVTITGSGKTLTIKDTLLRVLGTESVSCQTSDAKIVLDSSRIYTSRDGWAVSTGNVDVEGQSKVVGLKKVFYDFGLTASPQNNDFLAGPVDYLTLIRRLGFETNYVLIYQELAGVGKIYIQENTASNSTFRAASIDVAQDLSYQDSPTGSPTTVAGTFKSLGMGVDNQIWVVNTSRAIQRLDEPSTLVSAPSVGDKVSVGNQNQVFMVDDTTGITYKNDDPTAGSPGSWTAVSDVSAPRSISAGSDGTLWFIDNKGRCLKKVNSDIILVHDGIGYDWQRVNVSGDNSTNYIALVSSIANGGRVLVSRDNGPFFDLGLSMATDAAVGAYGSIAFKPSNIVVPEHTSTGQPSFFRLETQNASPLALDQTLTFSSTGDLTVKAGATLAFCDDGTLRYQPDPSGDAGVTYDTKRHLVMEDETAGLVLDGGNIVSTNTAMALDFGKLTIKSHCDISTSAATGSEFELGSAVELEVDAGSSINFYGPLEFISSSVP